MNHIDTMKLALEALEDISALQNHSDSADSSDVDRAITALREALAEQPAQQKPVAWLVDNGGDAVLIRHSENFPGVFAGSEFNKRPLVYGDTSSPASKPLTDDEIESINVRLAGSRDLARLFARAIEAAHGIKEQP